MSDAPDMPDKLLIKLVDNPNSVCDGMYICAAGGVEYRRADLPTTDPMDDPRVKALVGSLQGARQAMFEGCDADAFAILEAALAAREPDNG